MIELPEINLARRLVQRLSLRPPIDVFKVARRFAKVEQLDFPVDLDGVCLNLKQISKKPSIIVNEANRSRERIRFTLAHELGHVLIPWHVGSIVDAIDILHDDIDEYWRAEGEANRFASELLMPTEWVRQVLPTFSDPLDTIAHVASQAEVSFQAAVLKVINCLPPGNVFAQTEGGLVAFSGRSPGTLASQPAKGSFINPSKTFEWTPHRWSRQVGGSSYHWWQFKGDAPLPAPVSDEDWRTILQRIVEDMNVKKEDIPKFKMTINGVVGYANSNAKAHRTPSRIYEACLERFHSRAADDKRLARFVAHPKFTAYLSARVASLPT